MLDELNPVPTGTSTRLNARSEPNDKGQRGGLMNPDKVASACDELHDCV